MLNTNTCVFLPKTARLTYAISKFVHLYCTILIFQQRFLKFFAILKIVQIINNTATLWDWEFPLIKFIYFKKVIKFSKINPL